MASVETNEKGVVWYDARGKAWVWMTDNDYKEAYTATPEEAWKYEPTKPQPVDELQEKFGLYLDEVAFDPERAC